MIDTLIKTLYVFNKMLVLVVGLWLILMPPNNWLSTSASVVMILAALGSIYGIWTDNADVEFVSLWFVCAGLGVYAGLVWVQFELGDAPLTRAVVATMLLVMMIARGFHVYRLAKNINRLEGRISNHVD